MQRHTTLVLSDLYGCSTLHKQKTFRSMTACITAKRPGQNAKKKNTGSGWWAFLLGRMAKTGVLVKNWPLFLWVIWLPHQNPVRTSILSSGVKRSLANCSHLKFCFKGGPGGGQLNVIAGTGTGTARNAEHTGPIDVIEPLDSVFGFAFSLLFLDLDLYSLYYTLLYYTIIITIILP